MSKIRTFGWKLVPLSDHSIEDLKTLRAQVQEEHANPRDKDGRYLGGGVPSIYLYDKKGRKKLEVLEYAIGHQLEQRRKAAPSAPTP